MPKPEDILISIIIPTFNRAHLIEQTFDSVFVQTYSNWECIVVDDGSDDNTFDVLKKYCERDSRFMFFKRPEDRPAGGNGARNYGFEKSTGDFIQWFDSDDLMTPDKLEKSINAINIKNADVIISQTKYFNRDGFKDYEYDYVSEEINFEAYATTHLSWFTPDIFVKRIIAERIAFNEVLKAGQEYNYSCKMLLQTTKIAKINDVTTLRRHHEESIGRSRQKDKAYYYKTKFFSHWQTYLDCHEKAQNKTFNKFSLLKCALSYLQSNNKINLPNNFYNHLKQVLGKNAFYFKLASISNSAFGKYNRYYNKLKGI